MVCTQVEQTPPRQIKDKKKEAKSDRAKAGEGGKAPKPVKVRHSSTQSNLQRCE